jgi:hypothetical protein
VKLPLKYDQKYAFIFGSEYDLKLKYGSNMHLHDQ